MKKILVAVDGSAPSLRAAQAAIELAGSAAQVTLAHVVVTNTFTAPEVPFGATPWTEEAVQAGDAILDKTIEALGHPAVQRVNLAGPAAETLADYADREHFDLVVVGGKGRGAVARMLVGSVTDRLVHISRTALLIVR